MIRRALRASIYIVSFGAGRGALFAAPLILASLLPPAAYGALEFAQALATVAAPLLSLGTAAAVPLIVIQKVAEGSWNAVLGHHLACAFSLLVFAVSMFLVQQDSMAALIPIAVCALMLQTLWSVTLKSSGKPEASLMLETGFWGALALGAGGAFLLAVPENARIHAALGALVTYLSLLMVATVSALRKANRVETEWRYRETLKLGVPLMTASLLTFLATTSGRLGIGLLTAPEVVAEYAVLFRATALPMIAHQLLMIARFRQLFQLTSAELERRLVVVIVAVVACVAAFWALGSLLALLLGPAFAQAFARHRTEGILILVQCILWSGIALNDLMNSRTQSAGRAARATALYLLLALPGALLYLAYQPVTLSSYVPVHSGVMAGFFLTQVFSMWRAGIRLPLMWLIAFLSFVGLSALALAARTN